MNPRPYLSATDLRRHYVRGPETIRALDGVSLSVERGEFLGILGSSGSGKSTILNLLAGLDTPTSGEIELDGVPFSTMTRKQLSSYRAHSMGMVFQAFNLISHYTALQNVEMALFFNNTPPDRRRELAEKVLQSVGLGDRMTHRPSDLSGGEQQRVAIARAIVKKPEILFADEPTGNLDYESSEQVAALLTKLNNEGLTVLLVTHNRELAQQCTKRVVRMHYGRVVEQDDRAPRGSSR